MDNSKQLLGMFNALATIETFLSGSIIESTHDMDLIVRWYNFSNILLNKSNDSLNV